MRSVELGAAIAAFAAFAGCTNGCLLPSNLTRLDAQCESLPVPLDRLPVVGEPTTFEVALLTTCLRGSPRRATKVAVSVTDPSGKPVAHTAGAIGHDIHPRFNFVPLTFTAERAGAHRVSVAFDGLPGSAEYDLQAVERRTNTTERVIAWNGPTDCVGFTLTSKGTLSCMRRYPIGIEVPPGSEVITHRGQKLSGLGFGARGDVLWRITAESGVRRVERRVDDGTSFAVTHDGVNATAEGPIAIVGDDAWLVGSRNTLLRAHPEVDGSISFTSVPRTESPVEAMGGDSRGLMIASHRTNESMMAFVTPEGVVTLKRMHGDGFSYRLVGVDGDVLWTRLDRWNVGAFGPQRALVAVSGGGAATSPFIEVRAEIGTFADPKPADDVFGFFVPKVSIHRDGAHPNKPPTRPFAVPRLANGTIVLETFDVGPGFEYLRSATRTHVFAIAMDGKSVKVIDR